MRAASLLGSLLLLVRCAGDPSPTGYTQLGTVNATKQAVRAPLLAPRF